MAVVSHSVANPTHKTIKKQFRLRKEESKQILDIYGKKQSEKKTIYYKDWKSVTSASKGIPDFKEQDYLRTKTRVQKRAYYNEAKMTYSQASTKAGEVRSYGVTQSVAYDNDSLLKTLPKSAKGAPITWASMTTQAIATSIDGGNLEVHASGDSTNWNLKRGLLWFDLDGLPNHVSYSAAYLDLYTVPGACTKTDNEGSQVRVYRWTGPSYVSQYDFNDFDTGAASSMFNCTHSTTTAELNEIPLDSTLLDYLNDNPSGSMSGAGTGVIVAFMIRPQLDVAQALLSDPTGTNELIFYNHTYNNPATGQPQYRPTLRLEYSEPTIPGFKNVDGTQRITDHDGTALDVNDVVKIEGALSNIPNSNHNIIGKYSQNFLGQANRGDSSNWQIAVSSSGVDEANSELTLVNQTNGWNFKIKKKSLGNLTGSILNFNKIAD